MAELIINDVQYTSIPTEASWSIPVKYNANGEQVNHLKFGSNTFRNAAGVKTVLNAIEIDWNGAEVEDGVVINTTSDLINWIKSRESSVDPEALASIQNTIDIYQEALANAVTIKYVRDNYQAKGNYVTQEDFDSAMTNVQSTLNTLTEQLNNVVGDDINVRLSALEEAQQNFLTSDALATYATQEYVAEKIAEVVGAAPETLDTLKEIADKLSNNEDTVNALIGTIAEKASAADVYDKATIDSAISALQDSIDAIETTGGGAGADGKSAYELYKETVNEQDAKPAIYSFESWNNSSKEVKYGEGKVKVIEMRAGGATVEVIENNSTDPNAADFVGQQFNIALATGTDEPIQLNTLNNEPIDIWVTVNCIDEGHDAVVAMTEGEWLASLKGETGPQGATGETGPQGPSGEQGPQGATGTFDSSALENYATKDFVGEKISDVVGAAPEALDTLKEIADKLGDNDDAVTALTLQIANKANAADVYTKDEADAKFLTDHQDISGLATKAEIAEAGYLTEHQDISGLATKAEIAEAGYLTEHQSLEGYATEQYVDNAIEAIVGAAPENFDTLKELADAMGDLKVVDVEAVPAVEGEHYTQEEIDAAQEGDEAYGKTIDDWKVEPVEAIEEESHNMTIGEFVTSSMQAVDEKAAVAKVQAKYEALLTLLNIRESQVNSIIVNQELEESSTVEFDEPVDNIVIPETTSAYVVTGPLDDNSTVTLTSNKYMTLDNTSEEPVSATVQRPAEASETGTSGTTVYLVGQYDTLTLENVSPNVKSGRDAAQVNNVVISENNTKNLTLNLDLQDGATITNNSATAVTINDKNNEETVLAIVAPNSTVTLNGGTYTTLDAEVSDNTLVIKRNAHIGTLNVTKGNVKVEVARQSDIASVIDNLNIAEGYSVDYLHDDITAANISKLNTTGTHTFQEDLTKSGNFSVGLFSNDDIVWDLNGHNLTSSNTRGYGIFTLRGSAQLEINDTVGTGVVKNTADEYGFWTSTVNSKVIVNGGNFEAATHVLYAQKGTIEVNGGTFKLTDAATADKDQNGNFKFLLNCHDEDYVSGDAKIIVRGGKFYGFNPAVTYGEPGGPVSYVAEGYESVPTNEVYEYGTVYEVRPISE